MEQARVYSDIEFAIGETLNVGIFHPEGAFVEFRCCVTWVEHLGASAPARFDVALAFLT